jgi:general L-amino acid transport system substrate-binding protein
MNSDVTQRLRRFVIALLAAAALGGGAAPPRARADGPTGATLARVRAQGTVRCGGVMRPGLAFPGEDGKLQGLMVDICRAIAVAAIGPNGSSEFHGYVTPADGGRVARGEDDVAFMTASELARADAAGRGLPGSVLLGPAVFILSDGVMVWDSSPARHVADLSGTMVCAEPGTGPERMLAAYFAARGFKLDFSAWQEAEEMMDAFSVGRCPAIAQENPALAALRLHSESDGHPARILPEPLSATPLLAVTSPTDGAWSAAVAWTIDALTLAERAGPAEADALPVDAPGLGLAGDWPARVLKAVGTYGDIYRRHLGDLSPLDLPRGLNAGWEQGGLLCPPDVQ